MNRRALALLALAALLATSGCVGLFGGGGLDQEQLDREQSYDWSVRADAVYNVTGHTYHAVFDVENATTLEVYHRDEFGGEYAAGVSAVKFRAPNGTVYNNSVLTVEQEGSRTKITTPGPGKVAYTASAGNKHFQVPVIHEGSHVVITPRGTRTQAFLFGRVRPGGYRSWIEGDRTHLRWNEAPGGDIDVQYYLERDFYIFVGLVGAMAVLGVVGVAYYRRQIRQLERAREEVDVEAAGEE